MSLIDDLKNMVEIYETNNCTTEIREFSVIPPGGSVLNVGETFQFKVKVTNESELDMTSVMIRAIGSSHADVKYGGGIYSSSAVAGPFNIPAHQTYVSNFFQGRANGATVGAEVIVSARIDTWNASFDHILTDHSGFGVAEGTLTKQISID